MLYVFIESFVETHKIEDDILVYKIKGTFAHRDISAEYKEDNKYQGLEVLEENIYLDITSPTFTDIHLRYQADKDSLSSSAAFPAIGTVAMDLKDDNNTLKWNVYYHPQSSPDKTLNMFKSELRYEEPDEKVQIKVNWEEEAASELLNSLKDHVPKATGALYDYVNRCHREHTGLDLREASLKLRRSLQNSAEEAYERAVRQIDEVDMALQRAARNTAGTYQQWKDKAQSLYQDLLVQEGQVDFQKLQNKVFDSLIRLIEEYKVIVKHLMDSFIHYMKYTRFQLPGIADLLEKSAFISDLKIEFPFDPSSHKLIDVIWEYEEQLKFLSQQIQEALNDLQSINTTEKLSDLQKFLESIFESIEEEITHLKEKNLTYIINNIQYEINTIFRDYIPFVFEFLKESLYLNFGKFNELVQNKFQEASQELQQIQEFMKTLHKEYIDPSVVSWTVKYYELKEKIINLIKSLVDVLKDFNSKYTVEGRGQGSPLLNSLGGQVTASGES
ncbi:hypothetical protein MC885_004095 [Smutsia gigantea]|nr:hypothetical protein MC885_004095 [Smutsia gigantea]